MRREVSVLTRLTTKRPRNQYLTLAKFWTDRMKFFLVLLKWYSSLHKLSSLAFGKRRVPASWRGLRGITDCEPWHPIRIGWQRHYKLDVLDKFSIQPGHTYKFDAIALPYIPSIVLYTLSCSKDKSLRSLPGSHPWYPIYHPIHNLIDAYCVQPTIACYGTGFTGVERNTSCDSHPISSPDSAASFPKPASPKAPCSWANSPSSDLESLRPWTVLSWEMSVGHEHA